MTPEERLWTSGGSSFRGRAVEHRGEAVRAEVILGDVLPHKLICPLLRPHPQAPGSEPLILGVGGFPVDRRSFFLISRMSC